MAHSVPTILITLIVFTLELIFQTLTVKGELHGKICAALSHPNLNYFLSCAFLNHSRPNSVFSDI